MATVVHDHLDVIPVSGFKISWGGIWAGVLTVMGTLLFLTALGLAIGVSAVDPGQTDADTLATGAAMWSGLSLLVALFVGGMAATRLGMVFDRAAGAFEGALVWVLSFLVVLWLASSGVQLVASGISDLFGDINIGQTLDPSITDQARAQLPAMADRAQEGATKAAWITFAAMLISMIAAVAGAMVGRRRVVQTLARSHVPDEIANASLNEEIRRGRTP